MENVSGPGFNPNCFITRRLGVEPYKRCTSCQMKTHACLGMQYNLAVLLIFGASLLLFLSQTPWLHQVGLAAILAVLVLFGISINRQTDRIAATTKRLMDEIAREETLKVHLIRSEKLSAIGRMAAGTAHELNNALTPILGFTELLKGQTKKPPEELIEMIHRSALRAKKIVDSLLRFGRPPPPNRSPVHPNRLTEDTIAMVHYPYTTQGIAVTTDLASDLPPVFADFTQIQQVLLNLLNNARDAVKNTPSPRLTVRTMRREGAVRFEIANNGPPIPPEHLSMIFDPFFTTKEVGQGTGLGLALSYGIVRDHGGTIEVASRPEETVFSLEIPVASEEAAPAPPETEEAAGAPRNLRILAVDDEGEILDVIRKAFSRGGNAVRTASSGREAVACLDAEGFDLIISDIKMPDMSGIEFYEWIRERRPDMARRVLFITGDVADVTTQDLLSVCNCPYLAKPFNLSELFRAARGLLTAEPAPSAGRPT